MDTDKKSSSGMGRSKGTKLLKDLTHQELPVEKYARPDLLHDPRYWPLFGSSGG